jgi:sugar phosphate isomerase/epimerase
MFKLSAFADEIDPDPRRQIALLKRCGIRHIELRSIHGVNVLDLTDSQVKDLKSLLDSEGISLSAVGSPIGKVGVDEPFGLHLDRFRHALDLCKVFETPNLRIFSYYPGRFGDWHQWRGEVMYRMVAKARLAKQSGVRLLHENEHRIFGDDPHRVVDLLDTVQSAMGTDRFGAVYDPANYVFCGFDPWQAWQMTKKYTVHFHIKDWRAGDTHGSLAGEGQGRIVEVMAEAVQQNYDGFATLEPHLLGGDARGGATGPELFPRAVDAFKKVLDKVGASYQ